MKNSGWHLQRKNGAATLKARRANINLHLTFAS